MLLFVVFSPRLGIDYVLDLFPGYAGLIAKGIFGSGIYENLNNQIWFYN